jgi:hypothetical protein
MKKTFLFLFVVIITCSRAMAHPPAKFNYQGVARDTAGKPLANQRISLKISIVDVGTGIDSIVYTETHIDTTNQFGLFNVQVGGGIVVFGTMAGVNWIGAHGEKYLEVSMDPAGGTAYIKLGRERLWSVPFARRAEDAGFISIYSGGPGALPMFGNPNKMIIRHSVSAPTWGLQYNDADAQFNFLSAGLSVVDVDLKLKRLSIPGGFQLKSGVPGMGKVLVSDTAGVGTWQDFTTKMSSFQPVGCQSTPSVGTSYQKIADMGTFSKTTGGTFAKLTLQTNVYATSITGASGVIFELRIDNVATTIGNATALLRTAGTFDPISITGVFTGLSAGAHTVSLWVKTDVGTASTVGWDTACLNSFGTNNVLVEEYK